MELQRRLRDTGTKDSYKDSYSAKNTLLAMAMVGRISP